MTDESDKVVLLLDVVSLLSIGKISLLRGPESETAQGISLVDDRIRTLAPSVLAHKARRCIYYDKQTYLNTTLTVATLLTTSVTLAVYLPAAL